MKTENRKTVEDLAVEIDGAAALAYSIAAPLLENESTITPETLGSAIYSLAQYLERISADLTAHEAAELEDEREELAGE